MALTSPSYTLFNYLGTFQNILNDGSYLYNYPKFFLECSIIDFIYTTNLAPILKTSKNFYKLLETSRNFSNMALIIYLHASIIQITYLYFVSINFLRLLQNVHVLLLMVSPNCFLRMSDVLCKFLHCIVDGIIFLEDFVLKLWASIAIAKIVMFKNVVHFILFLVINHNQWQQQWLLLV